MQFKSKTINEFIEQLSSETSVPGGGSASALSGALGVSLILMVANLTVGKEKYAKYEELNQSVITESREIRDELLGLIDRDSEVYSNLLAAYKLPRVTDEEKEIRNKEIFDATLEAIKAPFEIMEVSLKALHLCSSLIGKSNENAVSDLGVSAQNLMACLSGAWLNVLINLKGQHIPDETAAYYKRRGLEIVDIGNKEAIYIYDSVKATLE